MTNWLGATMLTMIGRIKSSFLKFMKTDLYSATLFFAIALFLRSLPELIVPEYPVGYETITYYAPPLLFSKPGYVDLLETFITRSQFLIAQKPLFDTFRAGPLFYGLTLFVSSLSGVNGFVILKIAGPLLYGGLAFSFFIFVRRGLNLESRTAFLATLLMVFQPAALRESWDRYRTVLALVFFFAALTATKREWRMKWPIVAVLGILTVLSRDYIGVLLFVTIMGSAIYECKNRISSTAAMMPIFAILLAMYNPVWLSWNYLSNNSPFVTGDYASMVKDAFFIFVICYLPLLPLVLKGFSKNSTLMTMLVSLVLGSFSVALIPWMAIPGYQRWLMLLVFPLCVYSALGLQCFFSDKKRMLIVTTIVLAFMFVGMSYTTGFFSYTRVLPTSYIPGNLTGSSVSWNQVDDLKSCLSWLGNYTTSNSTLFVEERFYGWSLIYLKPNDGRISIMPYASASSFKASFEEARSRDIRQFYLIWYTNSTVQEFGLLHSEGAISVFKYSK